MIAISAKWTASPRIAPAPPMSVAAGNGPDPTKRSMSGMWRPNATVRIIAKPMSRAPDTKVDTAIGFTIESVIRIPPRSAMFLAYHQLQPRPDVVDRTDLHVDQMHRQRNLADDVLGDVGRHFRGALGPADPDEPGAVE